MTREHHDKLRHRAKVLRALADDAGATEPERDSARRKLAEIEAELASAQVEPAFAPAAAWEPPTFTPFAPAPPRQPSTGAGAARRRGYDLRDNIPFTAWGGFASTLPREEPRGEPAPAPPPPVDTAPLPPSTPTTPVGHYGVPSAAGAPRRGGGGGLPGGPFGGAGGRGPFGGSGGIF